MSDDKLARIVAARLRLKARHEAATARTPGVSDPAPLGTGPRNRHGMPTIPVGQTVTKTWPVLDLGIRPDVTTANFQLRVYGACEHPYQLDYPGLLDLPQVEDVSDFHCVTTWSKLDVRWRGVRLVDALALAEPRSEATHLLCEASDGYTTNLSLAEACKPDVLLVHTVDGSPLPYEHGGPVRVITPQLYAWKGSKWISGLRLLEHDQPGFWEERGYSNTANPWRDDRYG